MPAGGSHWLGHGWNWPVWPKQLFHSDGQWGTQATDTGLLGVLSPEAGLEVSSTTLDKSSWSLVATLGQVAVSLGHSMAECGEEGGAEASHVAGVMGIWSLILTLGRSTCNSEGSWTGLPRMSISQMGGFGRESSTGSRPLFGPFWAHYLTPALQELPHFQLTHTCRHYCSVSH